MLLTRGNPEAANSYRHAARHAGEFSVATAILEPCWNWRLLEWQGISQPPAQADALLSPGSWISLRRGYELGSAGLW
jgi:hypothetical protein